MRHLILALTCSLVWLTSCHMEATTKFYADRTGSAEVYISLDDHLASQMKNEGDSEAPTYNGTKVKDLPRDWTSLYDMALAQNDSAALLDKDTVELMKLIQVKFDIRNEKFRGYGFRIDRASEKEFIDFAKTIESFHPAASVDKEKTEMSTQALKVSWDGQKLIIPLGSQLDDPQDNENTKKVNDEPDPAYDMIKTMFEDANCSITYRYAFENKIKKIKGEHDFFRKVDDHTVEFKLDFMQLMEMSEKGQTLKKKDEVVTVFVK
ncbi:hypothetical protein RCC89_06210 [Cytophagaceae bacterium ABcell3]|nr:hypothetical protein RCC89_06210 [Cytophagaceae bacterium ABcell3]